MSKARYSYRRLRRKSSAQNTSAQGKQTAPSFFDFGGEHTFFSGQGAEAAMNKKCDSCENQDKVQKKENTSSGNTASPHVSYRIKSLQGGASLPPSVRSFFEPKFSANFSAVKVHNDSASQELAKAVNAKAFTYKNNIVFNKGQYDTQSDGGKKLLAHELTHVVQQNTSVSKKESETKENEKIQRAPATKDFIIQGKDPGSETDDSIIRFGVGQTDVTAPDTDKIKREAKKQKTVELNLNGFTSEEGTAAENTRVVKGRLKNVNRLLASEGHSAPRHEKPDITAGEGNANYRTRRVVEITPSFVAPGVPSVSAIDSCSTKALPCTSSVMGIVPLSMAKVVKSIVALTSPDATTNAQLSNFFGATPAGTVQKNLGALLGEIGTLAAAHDPSADCHKDTCDASCSQGASAYVDRNVTPAKMVFCESVMTTSADNRSEIFIHEALHATPGVLSDDFAYAHTRKMLTMSDAEKLKNTDSYVMLIRMLHDPKAVPTAPPKDTINGSTTAAEADFAKKAIAFLEQWLIASKFTSGDLYTEVHNALKNPASWQSPAGWYHHAMNDLSAIFGLTDPGTTNPFKVPQRDDKIRLAGIADRYLRMRSVLHSAPITLNKISSGSEKWATELGNQVNVQAPFFSKTDADAVRYLILLMLKSMSDVPSSLQSAYAQGADKIRGRNGVGP